MASSPPYEDPKSYLARKGSKVTKSTLSRTSKRTMSTQEHSPAIDGRHKRVWKACERCRMKKTKCDGESPCKRCKDDGLLCQAGTRRKTEYKQAPKGYAEVLESSQFALTNTVQKLYKMIRNGETWDFGEPDLNERGEVVIHDIVKKLGAVRQPTDLPQSFPQSEEDLEELSKQLYEANNAVSPEDNDSSRKHSHDSASSSPPTLKREDRASSTDSDASFQEPQYFGTSWNQPNGLSGSHQPSPFAVLAPNISTSRTSFDSNPTSVNTPSPIFDTFSPESPMMFDADSPFNAWASLDGEFLTQTHPLSETSHFLEGSRKQQQQQVAMPNVQQFAQFSRQGFIPDVVRGMQLAAATTTGAGATFQGDGTIRPSQMNASSAFDAMDYMQTSGGFN